MTQSDVLKLLKKNRKWMTSKEINNKLKFNAATANLNRLFRYGEVKKDWRKDGNIFKQFWKIK